jgi:SAM-dependent methyltransferase
MSGNFDASVVDGFGDEWSRFDQSSLSHAEWESLAEIYFELFPWSEMPQGAAGIDLGCGSGRWAKYAAPRVGMLHCVDASDAALAVARRTLANVQNVEFHRASVDHIPLPDASLDFAYSFGVLHHVPDTAAGIKQLVAKLKPGAPALLYLYYALENRPAWFRALWRLSNSLRFVISRLPHRLRYVASQLIAGLVYYPLARAAWLFERVGGKGDGLPLSAYRHRSFYVMRTDALDRFGTRLEQRFTKAQVTEMMTAAGLERIVFSERTFWCAVGWKASF